MPEDRFPCFVGRTLLLLAMSVAGAAQASDVGVLAGSGGCAEGSEALYVWIDNEDYNNANSASGWLGGSSVTENTLLQFCRVNGNQLWNVSVNEPFMVLKLGNCPTGTRGVVWRDIDAENTHDGPESHSNIPGVIDDLAYGSQSDVRLTFCVFVPPDSTGISFPDFGMEYGVFASSTFSRSLQAGQISMDDEDGENYNGWCRWMIAYPENTTECSDQGGYSNYWNIMDGGRNTTFHLARVRDAPSPGCSAMPTGASSLWPLGLILLAIVSRGRRRAAYTTY